MGLVDKQTRAQLTKRQRPGLFPEQFWKYAWMLPLFPKQKRTHTHVYLNNLFNDYASTD